MNTNELIYPNSQVINKECYLNTDPSNEEMKTSELCILNNFDYSMNIAGDSKLTINTINNNSKIESSKIQNNLRNSIELQNHSNFTNNKNLSEMDTEEPNTNIPINHFKYINCKNSNANSNSNSVRVSKNNSLKKNKKTRSDKSYKNSEKGKNDNTIQDDYKMDIEFGGFPLNNKTENNTINKNNPNIDKDLKKRFKKESDNKFTNEAISSRSRNSNKTIQSLNKNKEKIHIISAINNNKKKEISNQTNIEFTTNPIRDSLNNNNNKNQYNNSNEETNINYNYNSNNINYIDNDSCNIKSNQNNNLNDNIYEKNNNNIKNQRNFKYDKNKNNIIQDANFYSKFIPILQKYEKSIPLDYIPDIWRNLKTSEKCIACMPKFDSLLQQTDINFDMRAILIDWIIDVHKNYKLVTETLYICIAIIDRYLSKKSIMRTKLQLLGTTALFISSKYEDIIYPCIDEFTKITDDAYTKEEVLQMENEILLELDFDITYPSPFRFFEIISLNYNFSEIEFYYGCYLMEYFLISPNCNKYYPAIIALAVVLLILKLKKYPNYRDLYNLTDSPDNHKLIKECAQDIYDFPYKCRSINLNSVYNKYSSLQFHCVSINELDNHNFSNEGDNLDPTVEQIEIYKNIDTKMNNKNNE